MVLHSILTLTVSITLNDEITRSISKVMNIKKIAIISFIATAIAVSGTAQNRFPSEEIYPHRNDIYKKGWIDFNKNGRKDIYEDPKADVEKRLDDLLAQMNLEEKAGQLATYYGYKKVLTDTLPTAEWAKTFFRHGFANIDEHLNADVTDPERLSAEIAETQRFFVEYTRLGIPIDFTNEGIRGLNAPKATSFPSMNGLGCTWDKELAYLQGQVEAREAKVLGYTNINAPILDVARDQRWGRWEGTIGEDPYLVARLGVEMAKGIQDQGIVSTPKHFVGYGDCKAQRQFEARTDPHVTPSEMYYIHEYPFRAVFKEAGALGVMCAYNDYDGSPIAGSYHFLTEKLRGEMGFRGYVVSDSNAIKHLFSKHKVAADGKEACLQALSAGLNVRTTFNSPEEYIGYVMELVREGRLPESRVDELVRDVLRVKFWLGLFDDPYPGSPDKARETVSCDRHQDIALRASRECVVLLKNEDGMLPLKDKYRKIAVIGSNAINEKYVPGHYGPNHLDNIVSVVDGLKEVYKGHKDVSIRYAKGVDVTCKGWPENELFPDTLSTEEQKDIAEAVALVQDSDVAILVVGDDSGSSGESRTRTSLDLPGHQEELLQAVVSTGKPVVLVLVWGRPATINFADRYCPAIVAAGYPGAQGGRAIAEVLKGDYNPGGKLNGTWPRTVGQLPMNIPTKPFANYEYDGYTVGNKGLLYCFGHGLSYTSFGYSDMQIDSVHTQTGNVTVYCTVTNTGDVAGDEVVQMYINDVISSTTTYEKNLRGFERIHLEPGESKTVHFPIVAEDLILINADGEKVVEPGEFRVMVGSSYEDIRLQDSFFYRSSDHKSIQRNAAGKDKIMHDLDFPTE